LLGFRFAPRTRDLADSTLFAIGKPSEFPKLEKLLSGRINTKVIQENYDDVLRLAAIRALVVESPALWYTNLSVPARRPKGVVVL